ncbi:EAL domain-containing protein [Butyrivibrio sp. INlla16]|uniref:EAL domain-containing protein n=1 Tax=Butyrivibrio sp. INlla16 TaxID=1520807 RepID=UPI0008807B24|nr:GGDEF domain-containing phosphodiesterase [Butyrivibrio sp. INlla16]SDB38073.1 diguanylate cyclase (GGDEF) domain-containing protein [Butyrivibrio sp. INlla16]
MKVEEYTYQELKHMLDYMKRMYDTVRLVDPVECRVISVDTSGELHYEKECYSAWNAASRCSNCASYRAVMSSQRQTKEEVYDGHRFLVQSIPIKLVLPDRNNFSCVMELITVDDKEGETLPPTHQILTGEDEKQVSQGMTKTDYLVTHDLLTRLNNLDGICREVRRILVEDPDTKRVLITGDIRHFRTLNERYGVQRGNEVLIAIADMLRRNCGEDTVYGRTHADHFVLCMPEERFDEGVFMNAVEEIGQMIDTENYHLFFHLGVFRIDDPDIPVTVMIERADLALKYLHDRRENVLTFYTNKLLKQAENEIEFLNAFPKNLEEGQFHIFLQPIFDQKQRVTGAEALTRWIKPDGSITPSDKYIHILEKNDNIAKLDCENWERVMKQLRSWQATVRDHLVISVNVSPKDLFYMDALKKVKELVRAYSVDPNKLILEFSERDLMNDTELRLEILDKFRAEGFKVAIDNFGAGDFSINMLKELQADYIKLDKTFIDDALADPRSKIVLEACVKLIHQLGMKVVAEGVETQMQFDYLKSIDCDRFQGYYFTPAIPIQEFEEKY